tara:strand:+ start:630 stop:992 length:363 start_codon:yes stop_codon:yes gene_type:complete
MYKLTGFNTVLENGLVVSVQYHDTAYSTRDDDGKLASVEMACWRKVATGERVDVWLTYDVWSIEGNDCGVAAYVPVDNVMHMIDTATQLGADDVDMLHAKRELREAEYNIQETEQSLALT